MSDPIRYDVFQVSSYGQGPIWNKDKAAFLGGAAGDDEKLCNIVAASKPALVMVRKSYKYDNLIQVHLMIMIC